MANEQNLVPFTGADDPRRGKKPKGVPNTKTRLKRLLLLTEDLTNPITKEVEGFTVAEQLDLAQVIKARKGDTRAYTALMDRLEGKPIQSIDMNVSEDQTALTTEQKIKDFLDDKSDLPDNSASDGSVAETEVA